MNFFAFSGLVNGLVSTVCGTVVYLQNRHSRKNQIYTLYCLSLSIWSYLYFLWHLADNHDSALFYARALMFAAVFIPTLSYHHTITLFAKETPAQKKQLTLFYGLAFLFFLSNFTSYLVADVGQKMMIKYWQIPGPLYHPFLALFLFQVYLGLRFLWVQSQSASKPVRNEMLYVALATTIGYTSGCTNFCLQYDIPIPPYLNIVVSFYVVVAALLFFRLGLFDVRLVLKHISVVLLIYGSLLALVLSAAVPIANQLLKSPGANSISILLLFGLTIGLVLSIGPYIYAYLIKNKIWLRGHLTTGLTHELKSPLGIIQGALDQIETKLTQQATETDIRDYIAMARKNTDRLERNVGALLQVAKLHDGEFQIDKKTFKLDAMVAEIIDRYRSHANGRNIEFKQESNGNNDVHADQEKIGLVFSNILNNAIKFTEQGIIRIATSCIGKEVICAVSDTGRGISEVDLSKVFDGFYQGKNSTKGSGIGLTVAKGLIEAHGGKIWAESEGEGKGTTVTFTLPI